MQAISIQELISATGATPVGVDCLDSQFDRVSIDSRTLEAGDLFWAIQGQHLDGHDFVNEALQRGAIACVVDESRVEEFDGPVITVDDTLMAFWDLADWYRRHFEALVVGVTGSVGKTTTRRMIASVLGSRFSGIESPRNFNNEIGVPLSLFQLDPTHEYAIIELGATRPGDIQNLAEIAQPEVGVITTIGPSHLEQFGSFDNIVAAKGELLEALPESGFAILNGDDKNVLKMADRAQCDVITVGEKAHNSLIATDVSINNGWLRFFVDDNEFRVPVVGRHHLVSALIAIAIGRQIDMTDAEIAVGLKSYAPEQGRSQLRQIGPWTVIDDTYNSNPLSMSAAIRTLRDWETTGKRILVTGDMLSLGEWSDNFHELVGTEAVQARIHNVITIGQQAALVAGSAKRNGMDAGCLGVCHDESIAMLLLDCWLEPGDVVLVKGSRATHMETIIHNLELLANQQTNYEEPESRAA